MILKMFVSEKQELGYVIALLKITPQPVNKNGQKSWIWSNYIRQNILLNFIQYLLSLLSLKKKLKSSTT